MVHGPEHDLLVVDQQLARVGPLESAEDLQQGRLAGSVVADEAEDLAAGQVQVHVPQRRPRAEPLADVLGPQHVPAWRAAIAARWLCARSLGGHSVRPASRSRASCTLAIMAIRIAPPKMLSSGLALTPRMLNPSISVPSTIAPRAAPRTVPTPPSMAVPPMTAAVTA